MKRLGFLFILIAALQSLFLAAVIAAVSFFTRHKLDSENEENDI